MFLPENDGDKHLTLTAAVTQRFHTEAAIFGRYHFLPGAGSVISDVPYNSAYIIGLKKQHTLTLIL